MAKLFDRVGMSTATTGTGTITLGSAITDSTNGDLVSFATAGAANADVVSYLIVDGNAWELGTGTYTSSGTTLSRTLVKSSSGSLLTLSGSAKVYSAPIATDLKTPNLTEYTTTTPTAPADGSLLFSRKRAGRNTLAQIGPLGRSFDLQPGVGPRKVAWFSAKGSAANTTNQIFGLAFTSSGTATSRALASTNLLTMTRRNGYVPASAATNIPAGLTTDVAMAYRGNAAGRGGFYFVSRFGFTTWTAGNRMFCGMLDFFGVNTGEPSAGTNLLGIGCDSTDTTFQAMANDATGTATRTNSSITIAANVLYEVRAYVDAAGTTEYVSIEDITNGTFFEASFTTDLLATTTAVAPFVFANTGTVTTGAAIDISSIYLESET